ncbi:hypothetical protein EHQ53_13845 [Leptospira langatensis]|uniref:DUF5683 domain-containing protein n=1 Tax=Leptospira langatensis TaxID=2484983 RepID=A0A5F1ZRE1_9LEPT|nr:hypothetical protein [Leptospira langatensis]TGK02555.1 hypothetical protein EHO57_04270 [Leptospira langatensis]TGL40244.1 hypothetical protein EHQ53_13845 [Leptospira langatensis]
MKKRTYLIIIFLFFCIFKSSYVFSDTVRLKDGRSLTNVKSRIEGKVIVVEKADGSSQSYPIESLKAIEPGEVKPNPATQPSKKDAPQTVVEKKKQTEIPTPLEEPKQEAAQPPPYTPPKRNILWAPVPFWSGLNSEPQQKWGVPMSFFKGISFLFAIAYMKQPESARTEKEKLGQLLLLRRANQTSDETLLAFTYLRYKKFQDEVYTPSGDKSITREQYANRAHFVLGLFAAAVLIDGFLTWKYSSNLSIQGTPGSSARLKVTPTIEYFGSMHSSGIKAEASFLF